MLVVVHTITYAQRLRDVVSLLASDFRIQVVFTVAPHAFGDGVVRYLRSTGVTVVPWKQALRASWDLALAAGSQDVDRVRAPLVRLSHGAGHIKLLRKADVPASRRERVPGMLSRRHLVRDGRVVPAAIALSHVQELRVLARSCAEALPFATVVGDPCHDRIVASLPRRERFRRALGLAEGQQLVVVTSTWGPSSSFGRFDALLPRLLRELPRDRYRQVLLVHPNVWVGHGGWIRGWLAEAGRHDVVLLPPEADWRPVLVAADFVIGDHGSVTAYAALTGAPILVARFPETEVAADSPAAVLASSAPALSPVRPLDEQLRYAAAAPGAGAYQQVVNRITSEPGRFHRLMRALLYRILGLGEPAFEATAPPVPTPPSLARWAGPWDGPSTGTGAAA